MLGRERTERREDGAWGVAVVDLHGSGLEAFFGVDASNSRRLVV